jgi:hypothetical protein
LPNLWGAGPVRREIIESSEFTQQLLTIGDVERLDDALTGVYWALSTNPEVYDVVRGFRDIRLLKTDAIGDVPALRIWFRIDENGKHVHLEYIEVVSEDN